MFTDVLLLEFKTRYNFFSWFRSNVFSICLQVASYEIKGQMFFLHNFVFRFCYIYRNFYFYFATWWELVGFPTACKCIKHQQSQKILLIVAVFTCSVHRTSFFFTQHFNLYTYNHFGIQFVIRVWRPKVQQVITIDGTINAEPELVKCMDNLSGTKC